MRAHHDAHFASYVSKLNAALPALPAPPVRDDHALKRLLRRLPHVQPPALRAQIRNNGGGYLNHKHFFSCMTPGGAPLPPQSALAQRIHSQFGSFHTFETLFLDAARTLFGSGFVWLVRDAQQLRIVQYANQDNPALHGTVPVLACDCWEHAWYYQYGPNKAAYFAEWWKLIDWPAVCRYYEGKA
ncbi:Superoxide dismutase [Mn] [Gracilariopsis chorda]|uniref:Superoxide dismutase n=1 Tax=Gracilariopsis chorda TaxID=448386 RepID=A0A2V3IXW9_9FLOR|nr:Superoxide dismutase [Mn] [Gracilariopsis chorda]|eukprot:PXF46961.1 Superoxide dismutase [Mn] [Gracilariopsis chorda]